MKKIMYAILAPVLSLPYTIISGGIAGFFIYLATRVDLGNDTHTLVVQQILFYCAAVFVSLVFIVWAGIQNVCIEEGVKKAASMIDKSNYSVAAKLIIPTALYMVPVFILYIAIGFIFPQKRSNPLGELFELSSIVFVFILWKAFWSSHYHKYTIVLIFLAAAGYMAYSALFFLPLVYYFSLPLVMYVLHSYLNIVSKSKGVVKMLHLFIAILLLGVFLTLPYLEKIKGLIRHRNPEVEKLFEYGISWNVIMQEIEKNPGIVNYEHEDRTFLDNVLNEADSDYDFKVVQFLINKGTDLKRVDRFARTYLHIAAFRGRADAVKLLLEKGLDPNAKDYNKETPLHMADQKNCVETALHLIKAGADINALSSYKQTPLHRFSFNDNYKLVEVLLDAGARTDYKDYEDRTCLDMAKSDKVKELIKKQKKVW